MLAILKPVAVTMMLVIWIVKTISIPYNQNLSYESIFAFDLLLLITVFLASGRCTWFIKRLPPTTRQSSSLALSSTRWCLWSSSWWSLLYLSFSTSTDASR